MMNNKSLVEYFQEDGFSNVQFKGWKGDTTYFSGIDDETGEKIELEVTPQEPENQVKIRGYKDNNWYPLMAIHNQSA